MAACVAVIYGYWVVPAVRRTWPELRWSIAQATRSRPPRNFMRFAPSAQDRPRLGTFTWEGPLLTPGDAVSLQLPPEQLPLVNAILKVSFQEYLDLERQHWKQEHNEAGHLVTTIAPFPELFEQFESHLWSKLDRVLDEQQQSRSPRQSTDPSGSAYCRPDNHGPGRRPASSAGPARRSASKPGVTAPRITGPSRPAEIPTRSQVLNLPRSLPGSGTHSAKASHPSDWLAVFNDDGSDKHPAVELRVV